MADCADKEVFLGFFGWFSARSDRLMWHQPNPGPKAVSNRKVWFNHLYSVLGPHFHPDTPRHGPSRLTQPDTPVTQIFVCMIHTNCA